MHGDKPIALPAGPPPLPPPPTRAELESRVWPLPAPLPEPEGEPSLPPPPLPPAMFGRAMLAEQVEQHRQADNGTAESDADWSSDGDD